MMFRMKSGAVYLREIVGVALGGTGLETITIDSAFGVTIYKIRLIAFLSYLCLDLELTTLNCMLILRNR